MSVDLKDMNASEMLRHIAITVEDEECSSDAITWLRMKAGTEETPNCGAEMAHALVAIADRIDAEIETARNDAVKESKKPMWWFRSAIRQGEDWPEPCDGEKFRKYLERCFILRPLDEKGEPVQFGDIDISWKLVNGADALPDQYFRATAVDCDGCVLSTTDENEVVAIAKTDERGCVKRRAPVVLGADGLPVVPGETAYDLKSGIEIIVSRILTYDDGNSVVCADGDVYEMRFYPGDITHTPPDTQDRIDRDARKYFDEYWGCGVGECYLCPAKIDGKTPRDRFDTDSCSQAIVFDLLRRQRELDARNSYNM